MLAKRLIRKIATVCQASWSIRDGMWCSFCQHEVPAVVRSTRGPLVCSQCEREIAQRAVVDSTPADCGVALASFDSASPQDLASPVDFAGQEQTKQQLRKMGRQLRAKYRPKAGTGETPALRYDWANVSEPPPLPEETKLRAITKNSAHQATDDELPTASSWLTSMLLTGGVLGFCFGAGLLVWSAAFGLPKMWQWGMLSTMASEAALILGLVWMAVRLWRNSRRVNRELHSVDLQLAEMHHLAGSLAGSRMSSSQHYYDHFSQVASPHMLVANLRGQVDQLAGRIAAER